MHICDLEEQMTAGRWIVDWSQTGNCDYTKQADVIRTHRPRLQISLQELAEATYKDIANRIDPNFLRQGIRARALRGLRYDKFENDTMIFWVTSSEIQWNGIEYLNLVRFLSWDDLGGDPDLTPREKALMMLSTSDIQLYCNDPSFLFWGYQYILTQMGSSIYPENRPPVVRNPQQRGVVCKHLNRILRSLPFYSGDISKAITEQWGGKISKKEIDAIRRRYDLQQKANEGMELPPEAQPIDPLVSDEDMQTQLAPEETPEVNPHEIPPTNI